MNLTTFRPAIAALMIGVGFGAMVALFVPTNTDAAMLCSFSRNLSIGMYGDDVRCLQQYLNSNGYPVASYGAGAPGNETPTFGPLTQAAVARWQAGQGYPVTGVFEAAYMSSSVYVPSVGGSSTSGISHSSEARGVLSDIHDARDEYSDTLNDYIDALKNDDSVGSARSYLEDAQNELWDAYDAYTEGDYRAAQEYADDAQNDVNDAQDELGIRHHNNSNNNDSRADASNALSDARDAIANARREIKRSDSSSSAINRAQNDLDDAESAYDDAINAYDDHDYSEAIDYANDAEDYANDAIDEL